MYRRVWLAVIALWLSVVSGGGLAADVIHAADPFDGPLGDGAQDERRRIHSGNRLS